MLIREAAAALDMTPAAVYKAVNRGRFEKVQRVGPTVLIHEESVALYRQERKGKKGRPRKGQSRRPAGGPAPGPGSEG